jgi:malate dehydrogenase (oxaloacetate-decarboxylating)
MINFKEHHQYIETCLTGKSLLTSPQLNKGTAFDAHERKQFGLAGKLPPRIETLEEQVERAYLQFSKYSLDIQKHIYLNNLHDRNQVLFYKLVSTHLAEMVPLIYTPCVGTAVKEYSREFRQARGLFISVEDKNMLGEILDNRSNPDIDLIVVTDGEGVLGIGDQGVGSINIPIAKLMMYTLCAGISPLRTLPIYLDAGTNNPDLLNDPFYLGLRKPRVAQKEYDAFIDEFVRCVEQKFPLAFLHWEDFGRENARQILDRYQHTSCTFNDDIQGTGAVTLAAILAAVKKAGTHIRDQRVVIFGAGSAGTGIADQIYQAMCREGLPPDTARKNFWLLDRRGLLTEEHDQLGNAQKFYARSKQEIQHFNRTSENKIDLLETVIQAKPTILIGCSTQQGAFYQAIIKTMASFTKYPIILPLSNPTSLAEITPEQVFEWTDGMGLVATGSPFLPVNYRGKEYSIAQCNNALVFPGIGLGVLAARAKHVTDDMLWEASRTLSQLSGKALLPSLAQSRETAFLIAKAVAVKAIAQNLNRVEITPDEIDDYLKKTLWTPRYLPLKSL